MSNIFRPDGCEVNHVHRGLRVKETRKQEVFFRAAGVVRREPFRVGKKPASGQPAEVALVDQGGSGALVAAFKTLGKESASEREIRSQRLGRRLNLD